MIHIGVSDEGIPDYRLERLDDGRIVPDASVSEIHRSQQRQARQQIEIACKADDLGYDYAVHAEHHFSLLGPNSPNPVLTQTAIAAQTEDVRLLQMANILPWHEPVRLAEQIAMLDLVSDGRAEVGIGKGYGSAETAVFGQYWGGTTEDEFKHYKSFEEKYELLVEAWTEEFVAHHGQFHDVPPKHVEWENTHEYQYLDQTSNHDPTATMHVDSGTEKTALSALPVFPQPQQEPHPQLWKPVGSARAADWTARRGMNACCHCSDFSTTKELIDVYHDAAQAAEWPDRRPEYDGEPFGRGWDADRRRGVAVIVNVFNTEAADEKTYERWKLGQERGLSSKERLDSDDANSTEIDVEESLAEVDAPIVGDSEEIIDRLAELRETCGCEDFAVFVQTKVSGMSHEENLAQLCAFAEDVAPYFEETDQSQTVET